MSPEALAWGRSWRTVEKHRRALPAFVVLEVVAGMLEDRGLAWGPAGGVGYELASGLPVVTESSDLDLILRCPEPLPRMRPERSSKSSPPCRPASTRRSKPVPARWRSRSGPAERPVLLRRAEGPVLTEDPWDELA